MYKRQRIPELDGFRVLMVAIVAWFHFWQQSWLTPMIGSYSLDYLVRAGYMAVDGTILLSGFLLFLPYVRAARGEGPQVDTRAFFERRFTRIMPSYLFSVLLMLFAVAIPYGLYSRTGDLLYDLFMHVTCLFTWDRRTYLGTQLGGGAWTIAVEMQMYLLVPFLGKCLKKHPAAVVLGLCAVSAYFKAWCFFTMEEFGMVVNQPPAFFEVYALGIVCAYAYDSLSSWREGLGARARGFLSAGASVLFILSFWLFLRVLRVQAGSPNYPLIQSGQMYRRPVLTLTLSGMLLSLPFSLKPLRFLFGNGVMRFLASISMNFYLLHQSIAVQLRRMGIPYSVYEYPNQEGDTPWKYRYFALSLVLSLAAATLVTFLVEKPCAALLGRYFARRRQRGHDRAQAG